MGDGMGRFGVSYNDSFDQELEPNANYAFVVNTQKNIIEIPRTGTCPSCGKQLWCIFNVHNFDYFMVSR